MFQKDYSVLGTKSKIYTSRLHLLQDNSSSSEHLLKTFNHFENLNAGGGSYFEASLLNFLVQKQVLKRSLPFCGGRVE